MAGRGSDDDHVYLVTSAHKPHSEEISSRAKRYLISMGIRTVCLVLAIFAFHGWLRVIAIAAAIILPWFAVVLANAGPVIEEEEPEFIAPGHPELTAGERADTLPPADSQAAHDVHVTSERIGVWHHRTG